MYERKDAYDDGNERILVFLARELSGNVDTRQPAAVSRMRVVPSHGVFVSSNLINHVSGEDRIWYHKNDAYFATEIHVLHHVLVRFVCSVDSGFRSLHWQSE